jgi:hypothetical protein
VGAAARRISAWTTRRQLTAVLRQAYAIDLNLEEMIMTQRGRHWGCTSLFVLIGWLLVSLIHLRGFPINAVERLVPYDDFDTAHIDPDKWFGVEPGGLSTEAIRQLQDNRLSLVYRSYGKTDSEDNFTAK